MKPLITTLLLMAAFALSTAALLPVALAQVALAQGGATDQYGQPGGTGTLSFEVDTEGQVPEDTTFFGFSGFVGEPSSPIQLTDPDGDGTYTASRELERGAEIRVKIEQGSGTQESYNALAGRELTVPGEPRVVIEGPRTITLSEDTTVSTTATFDQQEDGTSDGTATLGFRLETESQPPEGATFFGLYGPPESDFSAVRLTDPDENGVYNGSVDLDEGETYAARLAQGTGTRETQLGTFPGEPTTLLKDFCASGCVTLTEDTTLSASGDFGEPAEEEPETVTVTGTLEEPESTSYQYGTHEITDAASGTTYALRGAEEVSLERYEGERVIVYGTREPGYPVEGGPELLNVTYVEPAGEPSRATEKSAPGLRPRLKPRPLPQQPPS